MADKLMVYVLAHFQDKTTNTFFYTSDLDKVLITRNRELTDNVIPSSNSSISKGLFYLGHLLYNDEYLSLSKAMLSGMSSNLPGNGSFLANWGILLYHHINAPYQVSILGEHCLDMKRVFDQHFLPQVLFAGSTKKSELAALEYKFVAGEHQIYVCQDKACLAPVGTVGEALVDIL